MATVTLRDLVKVYGRQPAVRGIDLEIADREFVVFVGPSGCGKSTTLRMIAGLETISHGELRIGGKLVNDVPSRTRGVAMVFQTYALYPHMTVQQNMSFGLGSVLEFGAYLDREPSQLRRASSARGHGFLRDEGRSIGCFANRYMTVLDAGDQPTERTYGMSWWNSLAALERWSESHPTHVRIFGAAMKYLSTLGPAAKLRLYHEVDGGARRGPVL